VTAEELDRLGTDPEPQARRIANAVAATVADDLDPGERGWVAALESLRAAMEASDEPISVALPNSRGVDKQAPLGDTCRRRSKKPRWALLLLLLARRLRPERALELGTCLGVSAGYLAGGLHLNDRGRLVTMEGARALADRSAANLAGLGLRNVEVVPGLFRTTLDEVLSRHRPVELAFVDGHHDERATLEYLDRIFPALAEPAVVVFDDIRWSEGMARAWVAIQDDPRVRVAVDLDRVGICVVGPPRPAVTARRYRLPTVTAMHARALGRSSAARQDGGLQAALAGAPARLHWGRGAPEGWAQLDGPIGGGLPLADRSVDYAAGGDALRRIPLPDLVPSLAELHRVLKPGGALRLCLPDLRGAIAALERGEDGYFEVSDRHAVTASGKFVTHVLWYGEAVSLFTPEWAEELLRRAGFVDVRRCLSGETSTGHADIAAADSRPRHSFVVEARR
jgi:predicted O-methyltransferase YrrM